MFQRTGLIIGTEGLAKLKKSSVVVFGIGGVGSFTTEALARAGIGTIKIIDSDVIDISNINRQIIATTKDIGKDKIEVMKRRIEDINPFCNVIAEKIFVDEKNVDDILDESFSYVVDAIDSVSSKIAIINWCDKNNVNIISSMGTGNKLDPTKFKISDIYKTKVCPLARVMRKKLKEINIEKLKVLYSEEEPKKACRIGDKIVPGSISFVPPVAGMIIAGEVIKDILNINQGENK
ncbi:MAG: ThiF family adenylyltransferase [Clostridiaceae bacterium]